MLLTGEWRWIPSRLAIDMALFVDAGRVGPTWNDVSSGTLKTDYGVGVRFHAPAATALRIDLARGAEGMRIVFTSSAPF
jgi:outer membrane translocation and assembly module TamA